MRSITISALEGNRQKLDGGSMFGNAPRTLWQKWHKPDSLGRIELACRSLLIKAKNNNIICETGIGNFFSPELAKRYGVINPEKNMLIDNLKEHGLSPNDINWVILSHLHFDHIGGLFIKDSSNQLSIAFPQAKIIVNKDAWHRACNPHIRDRASFVPELITILAASKQLVILDMHDKSPVLSDIIEFTYSNGHTPGQMLTIIKGDTHKVVFCGDLIPGASWMHTPITMGYDRYPELLIDEKVSFYKRALQHKWWLFFTHDPDFVMAQCSINEKSKITAINAIDKLSEFVI